MATVSKYRDIVDDFANEIWNRKSDGPKPSVAVINFRNELKTGRERRVYHVPVELLRYRKDNGRIASDVADYEKTIGPIEEQTDEGQAILAEFLRSKDPERTGILRKAIIQHGQSEPAIITSDGFLINGNRRKMVMEKLREEFHDTTNYSMMKVVILPGKGDTTEGGPPTLKEIEQIENRYQLQSDGKSEYYGFDRALSIKRKMELGLTLQEQLLDDPKFAEATPAELDKAVREWQKDYLEPLACVDRYLKQFDREGQYRTVSTGMSDKSGRWQAFIDYSNVYQRVFKSPKQLLSLGIEEEEIGEIEEAAFDIIRLRTIEGMPKVHTIMRDLPKLCSSSEGKREIMKIADEVEPLIEVKEMLDSSNNPLSPDDIDAKWIAKNRQPIIHHLKKAKTRFDITREKETPLTLLQAALEKLAPDVLDIGNLEMKDLPKARKINGAIAERTQEIEHAIYEFDKQYKKFKK